MLPRPYTEKNLSAVAVLNSEVYCSRVVTLLTMFFPICHECNAVIVRMGLTSMMPSSVVWMNIYDEVQVGFPI